ncbi:MAG TPA: hypothetical protein VFD19_00785, partial [Clostridia bacterium]|nr:hypothetical protein [Clostridia bacterium]
FIEHGQLQPESDGDFRKTPPPTGEDTESHEVLTHARHKAAIDRAITLVDRSKLDLQSGLSFDLVAITLKEALTELSTITGDDVSETLIETIFNRFCIGK